jgi:hypothetical protein
MYILYDFVCYDLFHILLSCDKIKDPWNVYMYVCMYVCGWRIDSPRSPAIVQITQFSQALFFI